MGARGVAPRPRRSKRRMLSVTPRARCPRAESNHHPLLRTQGSCPVDDEGGAGEGNQFFMGSKEANIWRDSFRVERLSYVPQASNSRHIARMAGVPCARSMAFSDRHSNTSMYAPFAARMRYGFLFAASPSRHSTRRCFCRTLRSAAPFPRLGL